MHYLTIFTHLTISNFLFSVTHQYFSSIFIFMQRKSAEGLDNNQEDKDDEKPTVVVLNDGDLSEEEAQKIKAVQAGNKMVMELFDKN